MKYTKQQTIYLLATKGIPFEIVKIINNYVFYGADLSEHRKKFKKIVKRIENSDRLTIRDDIWVRRWAMSIIDNEIDDNYNIQFQCQFCIKCGNFTSLTEEDVSEKALCICIHHNNDIEPGNYEEEESNVIYDDDDYWDDLYANTVLNWEY
jgi:hypothetical protein